MRDVQHCPLKGSWTIIIFLSAFFANIMEQYQLKYNIKQTMHNHNINHNTKNKIFTNPQLMELCISWLSSDLLPFWSSTLLSSLNSHPLALHCLSALLGAPSLTCSHLALAYLKLLSPNLCRLALHIFVLLGRLITLLEEKT